MEIPAVDAPQSKFTGVEQAVQLALNWEMEITRYINDLMALAIEQKDYAGPGYAALVRHRAGRGSRHHDGPVDGGPGR